MLAYLEMLYQLHRLSGTTKESLVIGIPIGHKCQSIYVQNPWSSSHVDIQTLRMPIDYAKTSDTASRIAYYSE